MLLHSILGFEVFSAPVSFVTSRTCWKTNASFIAECPHIHTTLDFLFREGLRLFSLSVHLGDVLFFFFTRLQEAPPF